MVIFIIVTMMILMIIMMVVMMMIKMTFHFFPFWKQVEIPTVIIALMGVKVKILMMKD